ncbi:MAG: allophanate hydrolase subunit 1 [Pseudomonadota bacterium]
MTDSLDVRFVGDDSLRIDGLSRGRRDGWCFDLQAQGGWVEIVPGRSSVTVQFDPLEILPEDARRKLVSLENQVASVVAPTPDPITIPVAYGGDYGPDLDAVCEALGMTQDRLIDQHTSNVHIVDFLGFTPGFAYLYTDQKNEIHVPRLDGPRQRVSIGSVGVVGGSTGLYALAGPGGWPIIGRSPMKLFDATSTPPSQLASGQKVIFCAISADTFKDLAE